ncbi:MAG: hypothetical protein H5U16_11425 [Roseovarius sp.]|nr:hypothetical protein [Roseovarius sp.]
MSELQLVKTRISAGVWEGVLSGRSQGAPEIEVTHLQTPLPGVEVSARAEGDWAVRVPIPPEAIADGVQTFLIRDRRDGTVLESITLIAGEALGHDIRAEMALLREELDLLKRAFRQHCRDTM